MATAKAEAEPKKKVHFKFPMHDMHLNKTLKNLKVACVLALISPLLLYTFNNLPKKMKYKNFYAKYDPMASFERMQSGGYLSSCPAEDKKKKKKDDKKDKKKDDKKKDDKKK